MNIVSALFFAISASSDALVVGISYGTKRIRINLLSNLAVSLIAGAGTFFAMLFGKALNLLIPSYLENLIGSALLILFGAYMLLKTLRGKQNETVPPPEDNSFTQLEYCSKVLQHPELADTDHSQIIELRESIVLGLMLSLNNAALGVGASITGLNPYVTSAAATLFSMVFLRVGCYAGMKFLYGKVSKYSDILSACIIILLGLYELFI